MNRITSIFIGSGLVLVIIALVLLLEFADKPSVDEKSLDTAPKVVHNKPLEANDENLEETEFSSKRKLAEEVWEVCDLASYVTENPSQFHSPTGEDMVELELSEACAKALEQHLWTINSLNWRDQYAEHEIAFLSLGSSMTFGRIFSDPAGDLQKVIEALSRPECLLENGTKVNWELKETCSAEAFMSFAEFYYFCRWDESISPLDGTDYRGVFTREQREKRQWKALFEFQWIKEKCSAFDSSMTISVQDNAEQFELLLEIGGPESEWMEEQRRQLEAILGKPFLGDRPYVEEAFIYETLVEFASRLGNKVAALTREGHEHGVFSNLFSSRPWFELSSKKSLSKKRLENAINFTMLLDRLEIDFSWKWLVEHLCSSENEQAITREQSCRTLINEFYFDDLVTGPRLEAVNQFERVAIELDVYE